MLSHSLLRRAIAIAAAWCLLLGPASLSAHTTAGHGSLDLHARTVFPSSALRLSTDLTNSRQQRGDKTGGMVLAGLAGGAVGIGVGALIGAGIEQSSSHCQGEEFCGLGGALIGASVGEAVFLPLGVHLAGGRRGNFAVEVAASVGIAAVGYGVALATNVPHPLIAVPIVQLIVAIRGENRKTSSE